MENIQILKYCPWISDEINVKEYFDKYNKLLDEVNGMKPHNEKVNMEEGLRDFFHMPDDFEAPLSRRSTPALSLFARSTSINSTDESLSKLSDAALKRSLSRDADSVNVNATLPLRSKSANDIENTEDCEETNVITDDPFCVQRMEEDCSIDLLNIEGELPPRDLCESGPIGDSGRVSNWYAGAFMDGVIPDGGPDKLVTLTCQAKELYKRETVKDYTRLRHRLLKYSSTVRMVMKNENSPEDIPLEADTSKSCLRDIILNIRIQRPYHKKSFQKKGMNRYPKHSQEMYMLGSQKLTELRDAVVCMNDAYVHEDMARNPDMSRCLSLPSSQAKFPSAFFYVSGVFYTDKRSPGALDTSVALKKWAKKYPIIGEMQTKDMGDASLSDLNLRLGYPYVYQHLGNCEHLVTVTDCRLHHRTDTQNPSRYPLSRGNPIKLSVTCYACNLHLANWILKDDPRIPAPYTHLCDQCVKLFCYDDAGLLVEPDSKLYPFFDEFAAEKAKKEREERDTASRNNVEIKIEGLDGKESTLIIEPFRE